MRKVCSVTFSQPLSVDLLAAQQRKPLAGARGTLGRVGWPPGEGGRAALGAAASPRPSTVCQSSVRPPRPPLFSGAFSPNAPVTENPSRRRIYSSSLGVLFTKEPKKLLSCNTSAISSFSEAALQVQVHPHHNATRGNWAALLLPLG